MITKLVLKNFKCFKEPEEFDFSQINVLSGINGVGKSTIIQALLLIAQSVKDGDFPYLRLDGRYVNLGTFFDVLNAYSGEETFSINISTCNGYEHHLFSSYRRPSSDENPWADFYSLEEDGHDFFEENSEDSTDDENESVQRSLGSTSALSVPKEFRYLYYIPADRKGPHNEEDIERAMDEFDIGLHGEHVINVLRLRGVSFQKQVEDALREVLQDATVRVEENGAKAKLFLGAGNDTKTFKPTNVGFAYGYLLPIVMAALLLPSNGLLFVENPEAHLHEGAQSRLIKFLCRVASEKKFQVFIETHSEHIVNGLLVAVHDSILPNDKIRVFHFGRVGNNHDVSMLSMGVEPGGQIRKTPDGFFDQVEKDLEVLTGIEDFKGRVND